MKLAIIIFLLSTVFVISTYGQVKGASQNLSEQAGKMGESFVSKNYKTFASYTYPLILRSMGGASKMVEVLNRTTNEMKTKGMSFSNVTFDEPSKIVKKGKELQATIAQHTEIKLPQGKLINTSTLIAVSTDNGVNWTFIDTSNKNIETLRKTFPNLDKSITIPPQQPPVRINK